jgi:signal transduction histidine kinase
MSKQYQRQFLLTASLIVLSFVLLGSAFIFFSYRYTIQDRRDTITADAQYVSEITGAYLDQGGSIDQRNFQVMLANVSLISDADVILVNPDGSIVQSASGQEVGTYAGEQLSTNMMALVTQTATSGGYTCMNDLGIYPSKQFVAITPIYSDYQTTPMGYTLISANAAALTEMWRIFTVIFTITAAVVLLLAFFSSYVTSLKEAKPLQEMADAARRFGQGEFDVRVDAHGRRDETGQLAEAFNSMADSLSKAETRRQEFIANISHELKTPMTTIAGFTDGILDGTIPAEKAPEYLQLVSSETRRLSRLVRKMLDLSKLQAEESITGHEQFDLGENMYQMLFSLEGKITARHLDMDIQIPDEPVMVWGEPDAITQVGYNLMDNAIKFSPEGAVIGLSITTRDNKAYVSIRNRGETISPEELSLIFDRFHKTDRSRSMDKDGVGLGLYIVKTILNNHKESITVTSENGITQFTFTLTLAR